MTLLVGAVALVALGLGDRDRQLDGLVLARQARLLGGLLIGFVPGLPRLALDPEVVFLIFLPPILYYTAVFTSFKDFRANLRPIFMLAVGLVLTTMAAVAVAAHTIAPELSWAAAFTLGAIVSPLDHRLS